MGVRRFCRLCWLCWRLGARLHVESTCFRRRRTIEPARPADSPPASQNPAGTVRPLAGQPLAAVFDSGTGQLAVLCPGSDPSASASIAVFGAAQAPPRVDRPAGERARADRRRSRHRLCGCPGRLLMVHLAGGDTEQVRVADAANADFTAIALRADGKLELGSADGAVYTLASAASGSRGQPEQDLRARRCPGDTR